MKRLLPLAVLLVTVPVSAEEKDASTETGFVHCVHENAPQLLVEIRDAQSQEAFEAAFARALEICPLEVEQMSMGRFFTAVNALIGPTSYEDEQ